MRGTFGFDPAQCTYGAATTAVRQILSEWTAVDWFEAPPRGAKAAAVALFEEHHALGRSHAPGLFQARIEVQPVRGGWDDFAGLCVRVSSPQGWDWKSSVLKRLSFEHSKARGWSLREEFIPDIPDMAPKDPVRGLGPGELFHRFREHLLWISLAPRLDLASVLPPGHADNARFYVGHASMDVLEAIEWQLAERSDRLDGNPFVPLVRCYAAGFLPFSLGPGTVVLFAFAPEA